MLFCAGQKITSTRVARGATQQFVAGERGIACFSTSFIRRGLNAARPRHLNSTVVRLILKSDGCHFSNGNNRRPWMKDSWGRGDS